MSDDVLTPPEAMALLKVSRSTLYRTSIDLIMHGGSTVAVRAEAT